VYPLCTKNEDGTEFWKSPKKPPTPLNFDPKNENLYTVVHGIPQVEWNATREAGKQEKWNFLNFSQKDIIADEKINAEEAAKVKKWIWMHFRLYRSSLPLLPI